MNYENLKKLRDYLESHFDTICTTINMRYYVTAVDIHGRPMENMLGAGADCGTTACLLGHGILSGVEGLTPNAWPGMVKYQVDTYGEFLCCHDLMTKGEVMMRFIFSSDWPDDLYQGIRRIDYVLAHHTVPEDWYKNGWPDWEYVL